jgi:ABC-type multidrug transport system fused ATPase/permease subunit
MGTDKVIPTDKSERIAQVLVAVLVLSGVLFLILWFPTWTSISFAIFVVVIFVISIVRSRGVDEKEIMRRQDERWARERMTQARWPVGFRSW